MPFLRRVVAAGPSPVVRARLTALFALPPATPEAALPSPAVAAPPESASSGAVSTESATPPGRAAAPGRATPPGRAAAPAGRGAVPDGAVPDGAVPDVAVRDGAVSDVAVRDGAAPDGPGAVRDGPGAAVAAPDDLARPPLRIDPGGRGAAALVALAVVAVGVTGFVVWRGRPRPVDVPAPGVVVSAPTTPAALVVVDVAGDVRRPGLVRLPPGSRVADALAAAGGLRSGATTAGLNLARKLVDGEQVVVGGRPPAAGPPAAGPPAAGLPPAGSAAGPGSGLPLDLNAATAEQLDALPGIGPVLADRIVQWRTANGPFTTVEQLREVSGIGARKFASLRDLVTV